jgi:hypothetical protein
MDSARGNPKRVIGRILLTAVFAAWAALAGVGCTSEEQVPPTIAPIDPDRTPDDPRLPLSGEINQIGDRVAVGDWEFVVLGEETINGADEDVTPENGADSDLEEGVGDEGEGLEIEIELTNRGTDGASIATDEFVLLDGQGGSYIPVSDNGDIVGPDSWESGQTETIMLVFEVPVGAADMTLEFRPRSGGLAAVYIR